MHLDDGICFATAEVMIYMNVKIIPQPRRTNEVIHALLLQMRRTKILQGCLKSTLSQDVTDPNVIFYQEEWNSWNEIENHIRSDGFSWILELMELSVNTPQLNFCDVHETRGMEYVRKVRTFKKTT